MTVANFLKEDVFIRALYWTFVVSMSLPYLTVGAVGKGTFEVVPLPDHSEAIVTLLHDELYLSGVRTLGASLRDERMDRDLVCMVTVLLSNQSFRTLRSDGWRLAYVPYQKKPKLVKGMDTRYHMRGVFSKLAVFNLPYSKILYMDADTFVMNSVSTLFQSSPNKVFGARFGFKNSTHFNSGVMLLTPSHNIYVDMLEKMEKIHQGDGLDQGFLNAYFPGIGDAPFCESVPRTSNRFPLCNTSVAGLCLCRLSRVYNVETGIFLTQRGRWSIPASTKIVHFALGPFKPWDWWTYWLVRPAKRWHTLRMSIEPQQESHHLVMLSVLYSVCILCHWWMTTQLCNRFEGKGFHPSKQVRLGHLVSGVAVTMISFPTSCYVSAMLLIPRQMHPMWAWAFFTTLVPFLQCVCCYFIVCFSSKMIPRSSKADGHTLWSWKIFTLNHGAIRIYYFHFLATSLSLLILPFVLGQPMPFRLGQVIFVFFLVNIVVDCVLMWVYSFRYP